MIAKYALSCCMIVVAVAPATPAMATAQRASAEEPEPRDVPEGFIVIKMAPATEDAAAEHGNEPRRITDRRDPDYVRCRFEPVAGSILKKRKICMTNRQWNLAIRLGNRNAREFVDDNQPGFMLH